MYINTILTKTLFSILSFSLLATYASKRLDEEDHKESDHTHLIPLLQKEVKQLKGQVRKLQNKSVYLQAEIEYLLKEVYLLKASNKDLQQFNLLFNNPITLFQNFNYANQNSTLQILPISFLYDLPDRFNQLSSNCNTLTKYKGKEKSRVTQSNLDGTTNVIMPKVGRGSHLAHDQFSRQSSIPESHMTPWINIQSIKLVSTKNQQKIQVQKISTKNKWNDQYKPFISEVLFSSFRGKFREIFHGNDLPWFINPNLLEGNSSEQKRPFVILIHYITLLAPKVIESLDSQRNRYRTIAIRYKKEKWYIVSTDKNKNKKNKKFNEKSNMAWDYCMMFKNPRNNNKIFHSISVRNRNKLVRNLKPFYLDVPLDLSLTIYVNCPVRHPNGAEREHNLHKLTAIPFVCAQTLGLGTMVINPNQGLAYITRFVPDEALYRTAGHILKGKKAIERKLFNLMPLTYMLYNGEYEKSSNTLKLPIHYNYQSRATIMNKYKTPHRNDSKSNRRISRR